MINTKSFYLNDLQAYLSETISIISSAVGHFLFGFPVPFTFPFPLPFGFCARIRTKDCWLTKIKTKVKLTHRSFIGHLCITSLHGSWGLLSQRRSSQTHLHHLLPIDTHSLALLGCNRMEMDPDSYELFQLTFFLP